MFFFEQAGTRLPGAHEPSPTTLQHIHNNLPRSD